MLALRALRRVSGAAFRSSTLVSLFDRCTGQFRPLMRTLVKQVAKGATPAVTAALQPHCGRYASSGKAGA